MIVFVYLFSVTVAALLGILVFIGVGLITTIPIGFVAGIVVFMLSFFLILGFISEP